MGCAHSSTAALAVSPPKPEPTTNATQLQEDEEQASRSSDDVVAEVKKAFASEKDFTKSIVRMETSADVPIEEVYDIDYDEEPLGFGAGGTVRRARHRSTNEYFAVKCLEKGRAEDLQQLRDEISIMCELDHPNIVRIEEVYESPTTLYIVQELCTGGELFDRLEDQSHFSEEQCAKLVKQMLAAVSYLHKHGIVHRDLKLENFLFTSPDEGAELVMIDFGLSKHFETGQHHHDPCGTPYTVAPEIIRGDYDEKVDMWALGVITYLILSGETPFGGLDEEDNQEVKERILRAHPDFEPRALWAGLSDSAKCFVERLLNPDPAQRPTAKQVQQDPWVRTCINNEGCRLRPATVEALLAFQGLSELEKLQSEVLSFTLFPEQIAELRKEFDKLDTEGDGEVSLVALKKAVTGSIDAGELEAAFDSIKLRKSALTLRWHEFLAAIISLARVDERNMRLAFDRLDRQAKGYLSLVELTGVLGSSIDSWDLERALPPSLGVQTDRITYTEFKRIPCFVTTATK